MRLYADQPARRTRQVLGDAAVLVWVLAWIAVGRAVHAAVARLAAPGRSLEDAGTSLEAGLRDAGDRLGGVPLVGDELGVPFDTAGDAARSLADVGVDLQAGVLRAALVTALAVAGWPVLAAVTAWLVVRLRFARTAERVRRVAATAPGLELLALRALARQPLQRLAAVDPDVAGAWRRGDPAVVQALAALELDDVGLRPGTAVGRPG